MISTRNKNWVVVKPGSVRAKFAYVHKAHADKKAAEINGEVLPKDKWLDMCSEPVEVVNILTGKTVTINRGSVGGACDPSTELFHSM